MAADITEKRGVVRALRKSERRLLESQRIARIGTIEHDLVTGEVVWTDEAFRLFGYEPGEVEPSFDAYLERLHPADLDKALQAKTALDGGEQMADAVRHVVWPDGSGHVLATVVNLEHDSSGNPIRLTRTIQDVTKLKERESEILRQEAFYKAVIEALDEAISVRDMDGHLLTSNGKRFWHKTQPSDLASLARLISVSDVIEEDGTPSIRLRHANELLECIEGGSRAAISRAEEVLNRCAGLL